MPNFRNDGVDIAYLDEGEGDPVVLVHGFAPSHSTIHAMARPPSSTIPPPTTAP
jgi:pimeloyl-ACP methyl ester carboxylesterase